MKVLLLVTGASGFLGRRLVLELATRHREAVVWAMVRPAARSAFGAWLDANRPLTEGVEVVEGDVTLELCGMPRHWAAPKRDTEVEVFHCAAYYDLAEDDAELNRMTNVEGTRNALRLAESIGARGFHHASTFAVAGNYRGIWSEEHHEEASSWRNEYGRSKHCAERLVRESTVPRRTIVRFGVLLGDAETGTCFKDDGVYAFLPLVRNVTRVVPRGLPLPVFGWGAVPVAPVDHAARCMAVLSLDAPDGLRVRHVFEDRVRRADDVLRLFLEAAGHETSINAGSLGHLVQWFEDQVEHDGVLAGLKEDVLDVLDKSDVPTELLAELNHPTSYSNAVTSAHLRSLGIESTDFEHYVPRLWHAWSAHDVIETRARRARFFVGKSVLVTGGTSGIGRTIVEKLIRRGADVLLLARDEEKVEQLREHTPAELRHRLSVLLCDLADDASITTAIAAIQDREVPVDVFVHSAGVSIDKPFLRMSEELDEVARMTQVNFLAPLRIVRGILPLMSSPEAVIVSVSTISTQIDIPGFGPYSATKLALDQTLRTVAADDPATKVSVVAVRLPLVKSPMTRMNPRLRGVPMISGGAAAERVLEATVGRNLVFDTSWGRIAEALRLLHPRAGSLLASLGWKVLLRLPYASRLAVAALTNDDG